MGDMLKEKRMLVTGGAVGIGKAICLAAAREGARVMIAEIDLPGAGETERAIREKGGKAEVIELDVTDYGAVQRAAREMEGEGRGPEILVNNAAVFVIAPFLETGPEDWQRGLSVTLLGTLNCCRAFLPAMVQRGAGAVVNIASDAGRVGEQSWSVYSAAKGGVIAFTKSLAREMARHGIRVNVVSPGTTRTEKIGAFIPQERQEKIARAYPLGRLAEPEEVAEAVVFLASDRASFITGQVLSVSGGFSMVG